MRFVDTNVLLYAVSKAAEEAPKGAIARGLLQEKDLALSVQVLQEFYVQATRSTRSDALRHDQAVRLVEAFCRYPVQELSLSIVQAAFLTSSRWSLSYRDAAILEAARSSGCEIVLSEDMKDGENYDGVQVVNPFRSVA